MPTYFSEVAPHCPISTDSAIGPKNARLFNSDPRPHRSTIPRVPEGDLRTALIAVNIARSIVTSMVRDTVKNNVKQAKGGGKVKIAPPKFKNKAARWTEQKSQRIKKKYKYYGIDREGKEDLNTYVIMERIERMVWYDKAWKSYLIWEYGDKGEGDPEPWRKP